MWMVIIPMNGPSAPSKQSTYPLKILFIMHSTLLLVERNGTPLSLREAPSYIWGPREDLLPSECCIKFVAWGSYERSLMISTWIRALVQRFNGHNLQRTVWIISDKWCSATPIWGWRRLGHQEAMGSRWMRLRIRVGIGQRYTRRRKTIFWILLIRRCCDYTFT